VEVSSGGPQNRQNEAPTKEGRNAQSASNYANLNDRFGYHHRRRGLLVVVAIIRISWSFPRVIIS
jgi:hypothetical protein